MVDRPEWQWGPVPGARATTKTGWLHLAIGNNEVHHQLQQFED